MSSTPSSERQGPTAHETAPSPRTTWKNRAIQLGHAARRALENLRRPDTQQTSSSPQTASPDTHRAVPPPPNSRPEQRTNAGFENPYVWESLKARSATDRHNRFNYYLQNNLHRDRGRMVLDLSVRAWAVDSEDISYDAERAAQASPIPKDLQTRTTTVLEDLGSDRRSLELIFRKSGNSVSGFVREFVHFYESQEKQQALSEKDYQDVAGIMRTSVTNPDNLLNELINSAQILNIQFTGNPAQEIPLPEIDLPPPNSTPTLGPKPDSATMKAAERQLENERRMVQVIENLETKRQAILGIAGKNLLLRLAANGVKLEALGNLELSKDALALIVLESALTGVSIHVLSMILSHSPVTDAGIAISLGVAGVAALESGRLHIGRLKLSPTWFIFVSTGKMLEGLGNLGPLKLAEKRLKSVPNTASETGKTQQEASHNAGMPPD